MTNQINELKLDKKPEDMSDEEKLAYLRKIMTDDQYADLLKAYEFRMGIERQHKEILRLIDESAANGGRE